MSKRKFNLGDILRRLNEEDEVVKNSPSPERDRQQPPLQRQELDRQKNPPSDFALKMLFLAEVLWTNPYTNSGLGKDHIDHQFVPPRFDPITKLYQALGNENPTTVINAINAGQNIINHDGHAWYSAMGVGNGSLYRSDMDALVNAPYFPLLFSIGCWPAAIDEDCIAEHFLTNPNGGGVAFIGNSRYGWGSPGNPLYGYSDRFDQQFFRAFLPEGQFHIGQYKLAQAVQARHQGRRICLMGGIQVQDVTTRTLHGPVDPGCGLTMSDSQIGDEFFPQEFDLRCT